LTAGGKGNAVMGHNTIRLAAVGIIGTAVIFSGQAMAIPTSSITITFGPTGGAPNIFDHTASASDQGASAAVQASPGPVVEAFSTSAITAQAQFSMSFEIDQIAGLNGVTTVPIDVSYVEEAVGDLNFTHSLDEFHIADGSLFSPYFFAELFSDDAGAIVTGTSSDASSTATYSTAAAGKPGVSLGTVVSMQMLASADGPGGSAFIDPVISIDPSFFINNPQYTAADFSLTESAGVGNSINSDSNPVPEPGSMILFAGATSLCGLLRRKKSRRQITV
jgi:hypothetical protein